jgi:hypothetical protein
MTTQIFSDFEIQEAKITLKEQEFQPAFSCQC